MCGVGRFLLLSLVRPCPSPAVLVATVVRRAQTPCTPYCSFFPKERLMPKDDPLYLRLYRDPLLIDLTRAIGYLGFPARELAHRLGELARQHGAQKLSLALREIVTFEGGRVMLNLKARKLAWQLLGP